MKLFRKILWLVALAALSPSQLFACAACGSENAQINSTLASGMNLGILTLFVVVAAVLGTFLVFLIHIIRKSEAMNAAAEKAAQPTNI